MTEDEMNQYTELKKQSEFRDVYYSEVKNHELRDVCTKKNAILFHKMKKS